MKLKELREQRGASREQVAGAAGVSLATIMRLEAGTVIPRFDVAQRIARFFDVPVESIEWEQSPDDDAGKDQPAVA